MIKCVPDKYLSPSHKKSLIKTKENNMLRVVAAKVQYKGGYLENEKFLKFSTLY